MTTNSPDLMALMKRLETAQNRHDLEAFLDCFDEDYRSEQPVHPDRVFQGREQVRKNWTTMFAELLDFRSKMLGGVADGDTLWTEWHWTGTHADGTPFNLRGVTIFGIRDNRIAWGRLYMEPVQVGGTGIDAAVDDMTKRAPRE